MLPDCFYQKAFWIVLGVFVTVLTSTTGLIYGQLSEDIKSVEERSIENQRELDRRFAPIFEDIPQIKEDVKVIKEQQAQTNILICKGLDLC